ncbi:MAG: SEL1-like repeat protein, partial [Planctomycetes bacterium]|nr:SEL1-like repeat protein [Planctomycetota bacterium]
MYWTARGHFFSKVRRSNLTASVPQDVVVEFEAVPRAIALDLTAGKLYWADDRIHQISRSNLDGSSRESLLTYTGSNFGGIALDVAAGKMYWCGDAGLWRASLGGADQEQLIDSAVLPRTSALALDVMNGKVYLADIEFDSILRANFDGSELEALVSSISRPFGIALDLPAGKMYWTSSSSDTIQRADLDGSNIETILSGLALPRAIALDLGAGKMYWTAGREIRRASLDGEDNEIVIRHHDDGGTGIALDTGLCLDDRSCTNGNDCTQEVCLDGACVDVADGVPDGSACNDRVACTFSDICSSGVCGGTPGNGCPTIRVWVREVYDANLVPKCGVTCPTQNLPEGIATLRDFIDLEVTIEGWDANPNSGRCDSGGSCSVSLQNCNSGPCRPFPLVQTLCWSLDEVTFFGSGSTPGLRIATLPCGVQEDCVCAYTSIPGELNDCADFAALSPGFCSCSNATCGGEADGCSIEASLYIDSSRTDWLYYSYGHIFAIDTVAPIFIFSEFFLGEPNGVSEYGPAPGRVPPYYAGTMLLEVADEASGVYVVDLHQFFRSGLAAGTFLVDAQADPLPTPAIIPLILNFGDIQDDDGDGVPNPIDNCIELSNPGQTDRDGDEIGDVCDNCPGVSNLDQGDADAQNNLGGMYKEGLGVAQDYAVAVRWYRKAAEQGYANAQKNLGFMYDNGLGVAQDYAAAVKWYRKAADQGSALAQNNLGVMYRNGWGVAQDYAAAVRLYRKAVDQGSAH